MRKPATLIKSLALGVVFAAAACATPAGPGRCRVAVDLKSTRAVNLDVDGVALPVTLQFYQLKAIERFRDATFEDVWLRADKSLGEDLVDMQERVVYPNQTKADTLLVQEEAEYLAVVALFREPRGTSWRAYRLLPKAGTADRCAEKKPGGPYYFLIRRSELKGSLHPFDSDKTETKSADSSQEE